jgi:hypothetical protein
MSLQLALSTYISITQIVAKPIKLCDPGPDS